MNTHLNHQQICDLLIDPAHPDVAASAHLAECPACAAELASLTAGLQTFQKASIHLADLEIARRPATTLLTPAARSRGLVALPALAAAAAVLVAVVFVPQHRSPSTRSASAHVMHTPVSAQPVSDASDEAILNEIDQDLDASVPSAMAPLAGPADSAGTASTQGNNQ